MALALTNSDIIETLESLADQILKAEGGTTNTLISNELTNVSEVEGYLICFMSGDLLGQETYIQSVNESTSTVTLENTLTNNVTTKTKFAILETGYESNIKRAEDIITSLLRNKGLDIDLFLNNAQLKQIHIYKTIELICLSKREDADSEDFYHSNFESFRELFQIEFSTLVADYDSNKNGVIDEGEENQKVSQAIFQR